MKRSSDALNATPNRRAMIQQHHPLLNDPEVVAFLDNTAPPVYDTLASKLVQANEPALLLELVRLVQGSDLNLQANDDGGDPLRLPDGLLDHVLQHILQLPCITSLTVGDAVLSAANCVQLQTVLAATTCSLRSLAFLDCSFADAHIQFQTTAATIRRMEWQDDLDDLGGQPPLDRVLPALAGWSKLEYLLLKSREDPINFALICQLLLHNPHITSLRVESDAASETPDQEPGLLLDSLANNRIRLTKLEFFVGDGYNEGFNDHCLRQLVGCLKTNTTLEWLEVPGIKMCTQAAKDHFLNGLNENRSLIELAPLDVFGDKMPAPVQRNKALRYWFTEGFVLGAAQAFVAMFDAPQDIGERVAGHLSTTRIDHIYCGAVMALICKSTHENAVKLRSSGLKEAALIHIRKNNQKSCLELLNALVKHKLDLLPGDKQLVIACATDLERLDFLPHGYAH